MKINKLNYYMDRSTEYVQRGDQWLSDCEDCGTPIDNLVEVFWDGNEMTWFN